MISQRNRAFEARGPGGGTKLDQERNRRHSGRPEVDSGGRRDQTCRIGESGNWRRTPGDRGRRDGREECQKDDRDQAHPAAHDASLLQRTLLSLHSSDIADRSATRTAFRITIRRHRLISVPAPYRRTGLRKRSGRRPTTGLDRARGTRMGRPQHILTTVLVSFVLRLVPDELAQGRLVGQIVAVGSGTEKPVKSADDLVEFCREHLFGRIGAIPPGQGDTTFDR